MPFYTHPLSELRHYSSTAFSLFDAYWIQIMLNNNWLVNPIDIISLDFVHMTGNFVHRKLQANMFGRFCKICTESLNLKNIRLCNNLNSTRQLIVITCNFHMQRHYINWQTNLQWSVYSEKWNFIFGAQMKYHHHHHHLGLGLKRLDQAVLSCSAWLALHPPVTPD